MSNQRPWEHSKTQRRFKSDQNGIEMKQRLWLHAERIRFKSDQNGIEIMLSFVSRCTKCASSNQTKMGLKFIQPSHMHFPPAMFKSDQNGIEILLLGCSFPQHCGFKSDQNGIEIITTAKLLRYIITALVQIRPKWDWNISLLVQIMSTLLSVQIRPKWDWNCSTSLEKSRRAGSSNQTKMGLK